MREDAVIEHFDVLFGAVAARLRLAAENACTGVLASPPDEPLQRLQATVLECVEALEQLQATQRHARISGDELQVRVETPWRVRSETF